MTIQPLPAVIILGENSLPVAQKITNILPGSTIYGLTNRTSNVDVHYTNFGDTLRELFTEGTPIIGICAAGILIRTLAPMLSNKRQEPPVLAIAEDGSAVVPLLGGLNGVNDLARQIATGLNVKAAITTTGDVRFGMVLENPPPGYRLANPEYAKSFTSEMLAGTKVKLEGNALWLGNSSLPIDPNGKLTILITEKLIASTSNRLVYHPATLAIAINPTTELTADELIPLIQQQLATANLASASIAGIFSPNVIANDTRIHAIAQALEIPARFFTPTQLEPSLSQGFNPTQASVLTAVGANGDLILSSPAIEIAIAPQAIDPNSIGQPQGKLAIIGIGPGSSQWMSPQVKEIIKSATDLVGYKTYLDLLGFLVDGKQIHESDNREELVRAKAALDLAATGKYVAVVSSGDPGIYAMAAAIFEALDYNSKPEWNSIEIQVAPGISAMQAAASRIGAPLGHDFCVISLSDILKSWSIIEQRITTAAQGDFAIAFYNPVSKERTWQLTAARDILLRYRNQNTPVVLASNLGRKGEKVKVITLEQLAPENADMRTVILIGSSQTRIIPRSNGDVWVYTPRRYDANIITSS
jgi:cobalt-precorrin 5A hydrolase / precorrin-3B C17-methyltransferase